MQKKFELFSINDDIATNRSDVYHFNREQVSFWLEGIQNKKRIEFSLLFDKDPEQSGEIEEIILTIQDLNREEVGQLVKSEQLVKLDCVDPEELFWIGTAFIKIAKHFGIDRKYFEEEEKEETK